MSDSGGKPHTLIASMRTLCVEIGHLLSTADYFLDKQGWTSSVQSARNAVIQPTSHDLNEPRKWLPRFFCRFYTNENYDGRLLFVAVILDNRDSQRFVVPVDELLFVAGFYSCTRAISTSDWDCHLCEWPLWRSDARKAFMPDPRVTPYPVPDSWGRDYPKLGIEELYSLVCPLTSIRDSTALKDLIDQLLKSCVDSMDKRAKSKS